MSDLPEPDPIAADRRRQRIRSKLPPGAACAECGLTEPDALILTPTHLLEDHHVLGRLAAPDATVVLCRNHHALQTGLQHDHQAIPRPGPGRVADSLLERIARAL